MSYRTFPSSDIKENSKLYLVLVAICIYNVAIQVFFPYLFVYLQYVVLPANEGLNFISAGVIIHAVLVIAFLVAGVVSANNTAVNKPPDDTRACVEPSKAGDVK